MGISRAPVQPLAAAVLAVIAALPTIAFAADTTYTTVGVNNPSALYFNPTNLPITLTYYSGADTQVVFSGSHTCSVTRGGTSGGGGAAAGGGGGGARTRRGFSGFGLGATAAGFD